MSTHPSSLLENFALVVPVFNEELRLNPEFIDGLNNLEYGMIIFVNDGCTDNSQEKIEDLLSDQTKRVWLENKANLGKAESLRRGMHRAIQEGFSIIATIDSDGANKLSDLEEISRYVAQQSLKMGLGENAGVVCSGARVRLAGWEINRSNQRQWIGRIIATLISLSQKLEMYDPQSPLKIYSLPLDGWAEVLENPFETRWFFDVEVISRMSRSSKMDKIHLYELPIKYFLDVPKSNLSLGSAFSILRELWYVSRLSRQNQKRRERKA